MIGCESEGVKPSGRHTTSPLSGERGGVEPM